MNVFFTYKKIFHTELSSEMIVERLLNMIREEDVYKLRELSVDTCHIEMEVFSEFILNRDSFLPIVSIDICKGDEETELKILCSLKKGVKIMGTIMLLFLAFMELSMLCLAMTNRLSNYWILTLPFAMAAFVLLLSIVGLTLSSRQVCKSIFKCVSA